VILIFIFFSPPKWFRDQPSIPYAAEITSLPDHQGEKVFLLRPELVDKIPEDKRVAEIGKIVTARTGKKFVMTHIEPEYDSEQEVIAYIGYARP
jgi:hypothetical protein